MSNKFDSRPETLKHIQQVRLILDEFRRLLYLRGLNHDASKLISPEKEAFDEATPKLQGLTYGSPEYKEGLEMLGGALEKHYASNRHHPEHHSQGIKGMNLVDLVELFCDWLAATKRHSDGDILRSLEINQKRFGMSDELTSILCNTVEAFNKDDQV